MSMIFLHQFSFFKNQNKEKKLILRLHLFIVGIPQGGSNETQENLGNVYFVEKFRQFMVALGSFKNN